MPFRDYEPYFSFGGKLDPLSEIRNAGIVTNGSVFWVKATGDADYTTFQDQVGAANIRNTVQDGIDLVRTDRNDYVIVVPQDANADFALGTAVDVNEDRIHLIAAGYTRSNRGYTVTLRGNYGTTPDTEVVAVAASGCELAGFRFLGTLGTHAGGTMSNAVLWMGTASSGTADETWVHDCTLETTSATGTPPLLSGVAASSDYCRFDNVHFQGGIESNINAVILPASAVGWEFNDCVFVKDAQATGDQFIIAGTGAIDYVSFNRCTFINREDGTIIASVVTGSVTTDNVIAMNYCTYYNVTEAGTDSRVFVAPAGSGTSSRVYDPGLAVGTAALVAN